MTDDATPATPLTRRMTSAAATLGVVLVVPVALGFLVAGSPAAGGAALGSLFGFLLALMTGLRRAAAFLVPIPLAAGLAAMLVGTVWWVVGLGLAATPAGIATQNCDDVNSYWLPMTIFVTVTVVVDVVLVDYLLAFAALVVAIAVPTPRWFNAACVSGAIVLALGPTSESVAVGGRFYVCQAMARVSSRWSSRAT